MTLLILGGTSEARQLAEFVAAEDIPAVLSLAGATRAPARMALPVRVGGFGGADGFREYIAAEGISAVLDATHPFAAAITDRTYAICSDQNLPYAQLLRPEWEPGYGDKWTMLETEEDAASHIPAGSTVFLGTGRQTLERFANLEGCRVICRQIDPPTEPFPFEGGEFLVGRPPFPVAQEKELFDVLGVDFLVVKNAGGAASYTKLEAARLLELSVLMIKRPPMPDLEPLETVEAAIRWVRGQKLRAQ